MVARRGTHPDGLSRRSEAALRPERHAPRTALLIAIRPIWDGSQSAGCHSPQTVHRWFIARHKSWRAVAALRTERRPGRPTRRQCVIVRRRGAHPGGLSLRAEAALRPERHTAWVVLRAWRKRQGPPNGGPCWHYCTLRRGTRRSTASSATPARTIRGWPIRSGWHPRRCVRRRG